jgi:hypothetical protein
VLKDVIISHPVSGLPHVEFKRAGETVTALVYVDQLSQAANCEGKEVLFELLQHPYGPDIRSDNGIAYVRKWSEGQ